ncbi:MAG: hypothetical protein AVDCRST_MAG26-1892, partial [uncultured Chloroflexia bacterium]
ETVGSRHPTASFTLLFLHNARVRHNGGGGSESLPDAAVGRPDARAGEAGRRRHKNAPGAPARRGRDRGDGRL